MTYPRTITFGGPKRALKSSKPKMGKAKGSPKIPAIKLPGGKRI